MPGAGAGLLEALSEGGDLRLQLFCRVCLVRGFLELPVDGGEGFRHRLLAGPDGIQVAGKGLGHPLLIVGELFCGADAEGQCDGEGGGQYKENGDGCERQADRGWAHAGDSCFRPQTSFWEITQE